MGCDLWQFNFFQVSVVSIHAPTWGATLLSVFRAKFLSCFNPRTHMGCDAANLEIFLHKLGFNPRTHMGCDNRTNFDFIVNGVSIHAPTWGATLATLNAYKSELLFQSTHPHGVRRGRRVERVGGSCVSIHAPTWGATLTGKLTNYVSPVSIHAPTWGATRKTCRKGGRVLCFNPRTHMGCDTIKQQQYYILDWFQSTHPHGVRHILTAAGGDLLLFQSTHPHGVRPLRMILSADVLSFNPRTHMGCDRKYFSYCR